MATHHHLDSETDLGFQAVAGQSQEHCWGARSDWLGRVLPAIPLDTVLLSLKQPACLPIWGERGIKSMKGGRNSERKGQKGSWAKAPTFRPASASAAYSGYSTAATHFVVLQGKQCLRLSAGALQFSARSFCLPPEQQASSTRTKHLRFNSLNHFISTTASQACAELPPAKGERIGEREANVSHVSVDRSNEVTKANEEENSKTTLKGLKCQSS